MGQRGQYNTKQRKLVQQCMSAHVDTYLTVDEVWSAIAGSGERIGRTTVYRNLESLVADRVVLKAIGPNGEARYHLAHAAGIGQLVCLNCGCATPLDCEMLRDFSAHIREEHGFAIDGARTVLYGYCGACSDTLKGGGDAR